MLVCSLHMPAKLRSFKSKVVFIGISSFIFLFSILLLFLYKHQTTPTTIRHSSISTNTFTVTMLTDWKAGSKLIVADNQQFTNPVEFSDTRVQESGNALRSNTHVLVARDLEPKTQYWYKVQSGFTTIHDTAIFTLKTPEVNKEATSPLPIFGNIIDQNGKPLPGVLVDVYAERADGTRSSTITTYSDEKGAYSTDLADLRQLNLSSYWDHESTIPAKIRVLARTQNEQYFYDIHNQEYQPVTTFVFGEVEQFADTNSIDSDSSLAQLYSRLIPSARADYGCYYKSDSDNNDTAICGASCTGDDEWEINGTCNRGTCVMKTDKKSCDEFSTDGASERTPENTTDGEKTVQCKEAQGAQSNCDYFKETNNVEVCGWEDNIKSITGKWGCGINDSQAQPQPTEDKSQMVCSFLHTTFAEVSKPGAAFAEKPCEAGNYARQETMKRPESKGLTYLDCGTGRAISTMDTTCATNPQQAPSPQTPANPPASVNNSNCVQAHGGSKEHYQCIAKGGKEGKGYARAFSDNECSYVVNQEYCNGACVAEGHVNECNGEQKPAQPAPEVTRKPDAPKPEPKPAKVEGTPAPQPATKPAQQNNTPQTVNPQQGSDLIEDWRRYCRDSNSGEVVSFVRRENETWVYEYSCVNIVYNEKCAGGNLVVRRWDTPSNTIKTLSCELGDPYPVCSSDPAMNCVPNEHYTPDPQSRLYCKRDRALHFCQCSQDRGICRPSVSVPLKSASTKMITDDSSACSGGLIQQQNGQPSVCFISHCMYNGFGGKNAPQTSSTLRTTSVRVQPYSCTQGEEAVIGVDRFYSIDDSYADPIMCANLTNEEVQKFSACASLMTLSGVAPTMGQNVFYTTQATYNVSGKVTGRDSDTVYRAPHQTPGVTVRFSNGSICHGDSGGMSYDANGNVLGSISYWVTEGGKMDPEYKLRNGRGCSSNINTVPFFTPSWSNTSPLYAQTSDTLSVLGVDDQKPPSLNNAITSSRFSLDSGKYELSNGVSIHINSPTEVSLYEDTNGNGVRDEGEPNAVGLALRINKVAESFTYEVNNGWNALNFPFFKNEDTSFKASEIRAQAAGQGVNIQSIKKWAGKWIEYTVAENKVYGTDFIIKPNEGYMVRALNTGTFTIFGVKGQEPVPLQTLNGWALVGVAPGNNQEGSVYSNKEFNDDITAFEFVKTARTKGIHINNITRYDNGVYRGVNITRKESGSYKEFGLDFAITAQEAYFIRADKKTVFVP